jgi:uncharacterized protein YbjT (DUF2867 family)
VFLLAAFSGDQVATGKQLVDAAQQAGGPQAVLLSGADAQPRTQSNHRHRAVEAYLEQGGVPCTVLRPSGCMPNFLTYNDDTIRLKNKFYQVIGAGQEVHYSDA